MTDIDVVKGIVRIVVFGIMGLLIMSHKELPWYAMPLLGFIAGVGAFVGWL